MMRVFRLQTGGEKGRDRHNGGASSPLLVKLLQWLPALQPLEPRQAIQEWALHAGKSVDWLS